MNQPPQLGLFALTALVVASMIGAGVFTTSGFALADLGSPHRVMLVWLLGGSIALLGAISYGLIVEEVRESGGEYVYLARNVHPLAGFLAGWVSMLAGFTGAIAFAASAFEAYLFPEHVIGGMPPNTVAIVLVLLAAALHSYVPRWGVLTQTWVVALKLSAIAVFIVVALWLAGGSLGAHPGPPVSDAPFAPTLMASSLVWVFLSYSGFNAAVYVAEEAIRVESLIPRSMMVGTLLVTILYLVINALFVYAAPYAVVAGAPNVAYVVAEYLGGGWFAETMRSIVLLGLFTSVLSMVMTGPRVYAKMADDGVLPRWFGAENGYSAAIMLQTGLAIMIIVATELRELLSYLGFTLSLSSAAAVASVFVNFRREPDKERPAWHWYVPALYVTLILGLAAFAARHDVVEFVAAVLTIGVGSLAYLLVKNEPS